MNEHQKELHDALRSYEPTAAAKKQLKRSLQQFMLEYGWWYEPIPNPDGIAQGTQKQCFKNATDLIITNASLIYCEGYAVWKSGMSPTHHAWVTDGTGRAIDNTWQPGGVAYVGVPFKSLYVTMTTLKNHGFVSLIDDWENGWPLCCDLGDRPEEWLELKGNGTSKVTQSRNDDDRETVIL